MDDTTSQAGVRIKQQQMANGSTTCACEKTHEKSIKTYNFIKNIKSCEK